MKTQAKRSLNGWMVVFTQIFVILDQSVVLLGVFFLIKALYPKKSELITRALHEKKHIFCHNICIILIINYDLFSRYIFGGMLSCSLWNINIYLFFT